MQPTIVIIDDDVDLCEILTHNLQDLDARIFVAHDGESGLNLIITEKPNVIITDYKMPGIDGLELLKRLREKKIFTPCIWISGSSDEPVFKEAWKFGVFDVQEKPLKMEKFKAAVETAIVHGLGFIKMRTHTPDRKVKRIDVPIALDPDLYKEIENAATLLGKTVPDYLSDMVEKEFAKKAS